MEPCESGNYAAEQRAAAGGRASAPGSYLSRVVARPQLSTNVRRQIHREFRLPIDRSKKAKLLAKLASAPDPPMIAVAAFFDGNDDPASIGCNLSDHPGIQTFRCVLETVGSRPLQKPIAI